MEQLGSHTLSWRNELAINRKIHPAGTSVGSVGYDKPVHSASHCGKWGHFFLACGQTYSVENPWISQSSLDLFRECLGA